MFTGIIEEVGRVREVRKQGNTMRIVIEAKRVLEDVKSGDSIAVSGVCLTVTDFGQDYFAADVMPQTFRMTNLHRHGVGARVNLERAMPMNGRFGGHIVQGHVDGTGVIVSIRPMENAVVYTVRPQNPDLFRYMIPQGSITLDGISLTLTEANGQHLAVSIIPHTLEMTSLQDKQAGDYLNIECDVLGKYVAHLLQHGRGPSDNVQGVTESFLREHGYA